MKFSSKQYAKALFESIESTEPKDQDKLLDNFSKVLADNNDLKLFEEIAEEFHKLELEHKGIKQVEVASAHPISRDNEQEIIKELNKLVKQDVALKKKVDEGLIGGVVIKFDDKIIDASVKNSLEELKNHLSE